MFLSASAAAGGEEDVEVFAQVTYVVSIIAAIVLSSVLYLVIAFLRESKKPLQQRTKKN